MFLNTLWWSITASSKTTSRCAKAAARGYVFVSETDTEVIAHLVHWELEQAVRCVKRCCGYSAAARCVRR
jgi:asparagine synthetase B (glutamine-hydrolysing)